FFRLRAVALALGLFRLRAVALALGLFRLRAVALALGLFRLRAVALALGLFRLRAVALALRLSTCHIPWKLLRTIGCRCELKEVARSESPWPASCDPRAQPVKNPGQHNSYSAGRTLEPRVVRPQRRAPLPRSAGGVL